MHFLWGHCFNDGLHTAARENWIHYSLSFNNITEVLLALLFYKYSMLKADDIKLISFPNFMPLNSIKPELTNVKFIMLNHLCWMNNLLWHLASGGCRIVDFSARVQQSLLLKKVEHVRSEEQFCTEV